MARVDLRLDWCSREAASSACRRWHYTGKPAIGPAIGVWEGGRFIGCVIYSLGSGKATCGKKYGFRKQRDIAELARVALVPAKHRQAPTSKIIATSIRLIRAHSPGLRALISFADEGWQGHVGAVYQATNWIYCGAFTGKADWIINGRRVHPRTFQERFKGCANRQDLVRKIDPNAHQVTAHKHRYLYPLDDDAKRRIEPFRQPYPKRAGGADGGTPGNQSGGGGSIPTPAL